MESLEKAIRALVLISLRDIEPPEQVKLLSTAGYKPSEIGDILGIKSNTAAKVLERARKGVGNGSKKGTPAPSFPGTSYDGEA